MVYIVSISFDWAMALSRGRMGEAEVWLVVRGPGWIVVKAVSSPLWTIELKMNVVYVIYLIFLFHTVVKHGKASSNYIKLKLLWWVSVFFTANSDLYYCNLAIANDVIVICRLRIWTQFEVYHQSRSMWLKFTACTSASPVYYNNYMRLEHLWESINVV